MRVRAGCQEAMTAGARRARISACAATPLGAHQRAEPAVAHGRRQFLIPVLGRKFDEPGPRARQSSASCRRVPERAIKRQLRKPPTPALQDYPLSADAGNERDGVTSDQEAEWRRLAETILTRSDCGDALLNDLVGRLKTSFRRSLAANQSRAQTATPAPRRLSGP